MEKSGGRKAELANMHSVKQRLDAAGIQDACQMPDRVSFWNL